jgi:hypothetical protein
MLQESVIRDIHQLCGDEDVSRKQAFIVATIFMPELIFTLVLLMDMM